MNPKKPQEERKTMSASNAGVPAPVNRSGVRPIYSNHIGASGTQTDFTLVFTEVSQNFGEQGGFTTNEVKALVTIPIPMIDQLIALLEHVKKQRLIMLEAQGGRA